LIEIGIKENRKIHLREWRVWVLRAREAANLLQFSFRRLQLILHLHYCSYTSCLHLPNLRKTGITTENHKIFKINHNLLKQTRPKSNPMRKGSSIAGRHSMNPSTGIFIWGEETAAAMWIPITIDSNSFLVFVYWLYLMEQ